ncbi:universal stress protein [Aurantibacter crassamenti]|uniref:universal stress protein n=1 Tax=Aurantibacter crassamenti TaxID=1837375 RepID=UPI00193A7A27|nr:universal stress protein [Aurantibacter crassamenti]MBM1105894.1 universal stress protein [Aurantibacter crassamenti]
MKKILIPTDFSENAFNALEYATKLYTHEACIFYLMNVYTPPVYQSEYLMDSAMQFESYNFTQRTESLNKLIAVQEQIENISQNPKHKFMTHSAFNTLVEEILEIEKKEDINIIIMGTQGATGAEEILFGSNTVHVIKKSKCPVIAVPAKYTFEAPKEILFPTDYEADYQNSRLDEIIYLAKNFDSKLNILHVASGLDLTTAQKDKKVLLEKRVGKNTHQFYNFADMEIITAINEFQSKHKTQLLTMIRNKHTFFERLFVEPIIKKIAFHVKIPFMVIPHCK